MLDTFSEQPASIFTQGTTTTDTVSKSCIDVNICITAETSNDVHARLYSNSALFIINDPQNLVRTLLTSLSLSFIVSER